MTPSLTLPVTAAGFESPSLGSPGDGAGPSYELKFLLDEVRAQEIEGWARERMAVDPHGEPSLGGAYRTTSLYCDTPALDVYRRTEAYKRHKFRVRRYGSAPWAFLERKSKDAERVEKRRTPVPEWELPFLGNLPPESWPGRWFHGSLRSSGLLPACQITYRRTAFAGQCDDRSLRLTLDRDVCGTLTTEWGLPSIKGGRPLLAGQVILEFKFRATLPEPFRDLIRDRGLNLSTVSKYRLCREAWGVQV